MGGVSSNGEVKIVRFHKERSMSVVGGREVSLHATRGKERVYILGEI